jgi:hypothetical protein
MQDETKKMLTSIAAFFASSDVSSNSKRELWDILSAIRGPDEYKTDMDEETRKQINDYVLPTLDEVKAATTGVIRFHILSMGGHNAYEGIIYKDIAIVEKDSQTMITRRLGEMKHMSYHFIQHARDAFRALDMTWEGINSRES